MRLTGGQAKRMRLVAPKGLLTRPTSDFVRENLFNILQPLAASSRFLDLFAGSGAVGLEAWSRGAEHVVLVESDRHALEAMQKNLSHLGCNERVRVVGRPVERALRELASAGVQFSHLFLDPPYRPEELLVSALGRLARGSFDLPGALFIAQHGSKTRLPEQFETLSRCDVRRYGKTTLSFFRREVTR